MLVFLAQSPAFTPGELASFLAILAFLLGIVIAVRKVFGHEPPLHKEYATKSDTSVLKAEIEKLDTERRTSVANLHAKIDTQISALRSELNAKVDRLESRIDAVPERTIKLLRETKDLI